VGLLYLLTLYTAEMSTPWVTGRAAGGVGPDRVKLFVNYVASDR